MSINKNDCLDCANSIKKGNSRYDGDWICEKGHIIPIDKNGIIEVLDHECKDFSYVE
jgi:hypothetical protein